MSVFLKYACDERTWRPLPREYSPLKITITQKSKRKKVNWTISFLKQHDIFLRARLIDRRGMGSDVPSRYACERVQSRHDCYCSRINNPPGGRLFACQLLKRAETGWETGRGSGRGATAWANLSRWDYPARATRKLILLRAKANESH